MLNKIPNWLLLILPALLLWAGWTFAPLFFLLFFGFIPLFELVKRLNGASKPRFFLKLYAAILLWNISLTWWVWNSTPAGAAVMLVLNTLFMCIPFLLYRKLHQKLGVTSVYLFVLLWLCYEFLHHRWDLSWPWLTLGNGLAGVPWLVQWYDITGTLGGSAFVLAMNVLIWHALFNPQRKIVLYPVLLFALVFVSSWFNGWKFRTYFENRKDKADVVALQSNYDPWTEKFNRNPMDLEAEMMRLSATAVDSNTDLLVWPETALTAGIDVNSTKQNSQLVQLELFRRKYPKLAILSGADMQEMYQNKPTRPSGTARPTEDPNTWWDAYNSAVFLNDSGNVQWYHKTILVPGTEQMPFVDALPWINDLAVKLDKNSISGSLGKSKNHLVFGNGSLHVAPAICYEGIYGGHVGQFVRQKANLIAIITNDGWWGNTPVHEQHLRYGLLRAIEHRRWVVRAANTGISCFADPMGTVVQAAAVNESKALKQTVYLNNYMTIYSKLGDTPILLMLCAISLLLFFRAKKSE